MKRFTLFFAVTVLLFSGSTVLAAVPQLINFQGKLSTPSGDTVNPGSYNVTFRFWDAASGGTELWNSGSQAVNVAAGLFNTLLSAPEGVFNGDQRWLGITVAPDVAELTPRTQIVSVGFSYRVGSVDGASGGTITSKVSIGPGHTNTGTNAFVAGENNTASGNWSTVGGGGGPTILESNSTFGAFSTVSGGTNNTAGGDYSAISGGSGNIANGFYSTAGGGQINAASGFNATVGGGGSNSAGGDNAAVGGGFGNTASGIYSTMGGGRDNIAADTGSTVAGGRNNRARGWYATVSGGGGATLADSNSASGNWATVPGGRGNRASGRYSFSAGRRAKADDDGSFVWGDSTNADVVSTAPNQFVVRAGNGLVLPSNATAAKAVAIGEHYRDNGIIAWGKVNGATGAITDDYGVVEAVRLDPGEYQITINASTAGNGASMIPIATSIGLTSFAKVSIAGASVFYVVTFSGGVLEDSDFVFMVTGR